MPAKMPTEMPAKMHTEIPAKMHTEMPANMPVTAVVALIVHIKMKTLKTP
jgi:hypothetical protein